MKKFKNASTVPYCFGKLFEAPEGFEFKPSFAYANVAEFRNPEPGEWFCDSESFTAIQAHETIRTTYGPRLILKKVEPPKPKVEVAHKPTFAFRYLRHDRWVDTNEFYSLGQRV